MRALIYIFIAWIALAVPSFSQVVSNGLSKYVSVDIVPGWKTSRGSHMAAVRFRLAPGWKTYWRAPGGNGIPPQFNWSGSKNLKGVSLHWPAPKVFVQQGLRSIGYTKELVLPVEFFPKSSSKSIAASMTVDFGVCEDLCVPAQASLTSNLQAGSKAEQAVIKRALAQRPKSAKSAGVTSVTCEALPTAKGLKLKAKLRKKSSFGAQDTVIFEMNQPNIWIKNVRSKSTGKQLTASAEIVNFAGGGLALDRSQLRLTVLGAKGAIDIKGCPAG